VGQNLTECPLRRPIEGWIEPSEVSLGPGCCLSILHGPVLYLGILFGPDLPCVVHRPDLRPRILHGPDHSVLLHSPDICSGTMQAPDVPVRLRGRSLCPGMMVHDLGSGILYGLHGPDPCPCIFLGCPSLEFLEQG
jgi:hypothetical protein